MFHLLSEQTVKSLKFKKKEKKELEEQSFVALVTIRDVDLN